MQCLQDLDKDAAGGPAVLDVRILMFGFPSSSVSQDIRINRISNHLALCFLLRFTAVLNFWNALVSLSSAVIKGMRKECGVLSDKCLGQGKPVEAESNGPIASTVQSRPYSDFTELPSRCFSLDILLS